MANGRLGQVQPTRGAGHTAFAVNRVEYREQVQIGSCHLKSTGFLNALGAHPKVCTILIPVRPGTKFIGSILGIVRRQDALRILETDRLHHTADRTRDPGNDLHHLPVRLGDFPRRVRYEFRRRDRDEDVGAYAGC